jgi:mannose-6-phosphate isomerase-like protein (cupin superfamily)
MTANQTPGKIRLAEKLSLFDDCWRPRIVGEVNDQYVKVVKLKGEFVWHRHEGEDELFLVLKGELTIRFRDGDVQLGEGEMLVVPCGVEHLPIATEEAHVLLVEPKSTVNTGSVKNERTVERLDWI